MKTALLQCNPVTGDIAGNVEKIAAAVRRAGDVDLCVTPELALSGLNPGDYLSMNDFVEGCRRGLDILAETFKDGPDLLVGAPVISVYDPKLLSNAAVHIHGGTWEVVSRKIRHPASQDPEARFFDRGVSCGIMTLQGWRLGVVLCESDSSDEFWNVQGVGHNPLLDLISRGVDAIAYMTATPYTKDRAGEEYAILSHVAARHHVHLLCVNAVGGNDGLVYAGQSTAFDPTGALYARGKAFEEDVVVLDTAGGSAPVAPDFASWEEGVFGALVLGTRDFVNKCGLTRGIVGLSGGIDSALVLSVGVEALGKDNVTAVLMPSPYSSRGSVDDAAELVKHLGVKSVVMPIEPVMKAFEQTMSQGLGMFETYPGDFTFENVQARIRGTLVTSLANRARALVLNRATRARAPWATALSMATRWAPWALSPTLPKPRFMTWPSGTTAREAATSSREPSSRRHLPPNSIPARRIPTPSRPTVNSIPSSRRSSRPSREPRFLPAARAVPRCAPVSSGRNSSAVRSPSPCT